MHSLNDWDFEGFDIVLINIALIAWSERHLLWPAKAALH
jgi:hypothetical protein